MNDPVQDLQQAVNIGPVLARELARAGFASIEELRSAGYIEVVRKLRAVNPERDCMNSALAIAGAIRGVRWMQMPKPERARITAEVREAFPTG